MLQVDTVSINMEVKKIDEYIAEFIDNNNNFFNDLSKVDSYWKDDDTPLFYEMFKKDKENSFYVIETLEKLSSLYKNISILYEKNS